MGEREGRDADGDGTSKNGTRSRDIAATWLALSSFSLVYRRKQLETPQLVY